MNEVWEGSRRMAGRLDGKRILILETREEAQFSRLLAEQGARVLQCPMFMIEDAPDPAPVEAWVTRAIDTPFDDLVLMTGEGLRRLMNVAQRIGRAETFVAALGQGRIFARGPKPGKALREIGLQGDVTTHMPTTEGVVAMLVGYDLTGHRVGLQLYPEKDHAALIRAIEARGAQVDPVLPYIYDGRAAADRIAEAIEAMASRTIDALALTSSGQFRRLLDAAKANGGEARLMAALRQTRIASIGPVVTNELAAHGLVPDITPTNGAYFMKPLISAMAVALKKTSDLADIRT